MLGFGPIAGAPIAATSAAAPPGNEQYASPAGFDALTIGDFLASWTQEVTASGFDTLSIGGVYQASWTQYLAPSGFDSSKVFLSGTAWYVPRVDFEFDAPYTPPVGGIANFDIARADGEIAPQGFDSLQIGGVLQAAWRQYADPTGFETLGIGGVWKLIYSRTADMAFAGEYVPPSGGATNFILDQQPNTLYPPGHDYSAVGAPAVRDNKLLPAGIGALGVSSPTIYNSDQIAGASGFTTQAFGGATIYNQDQAILLSGFASQAFGTAALRTNKLFPTGISTAAFGTAFVRTNKIFPLGIQALSIPAPKARGNKLFPASISTLKFGLHKIEDRSVVPHGADSAEFGAPVIDFYVRNVYPEGLYSTEFGADTFIADEIRYAPAGGYDATEWGAATVTRSPAPTVGDTMRFGTTTIWNFTRYVAPTEVDAIMYVDGASLTGPNRKFGKASISNWIRYLEPPGLSSQLISTQTRIENWLRYVYPKPISSFQYGTAWASHSPRWVTPPGFDSANVWNDYAPPDAVGHFANIRLKDGGAIALSGLESLSMGEPPDIGHEVRNILARSATCHCVTQFGLGRIAHVS